MPIERKDESSKRRFEIEGEDLGYPTLFREGSSAAALFVVDAGAAQQLIEGTGFEIAEIAPGRGILAFTCVHYTDKDCGVYEETAQAFFVRRLDDEDSFLSSVPGVGRYLSTWRDFLTGRVASYTWRLQVTTRLSQQCGLQMWGFPKELADIEFEQNDGRLRCSLRMEDRPVFQFSMKAGGRKTPAPITSSVYSIYQGEPHVSHLTQSYRETGYALGGATIVLGDHPLADAFRSLGLPKTPLFSTWNGHLCFSMTAPEKLQRGKLRAATQ
ncbi:MAG: acetoacetate decarboxylase family protein [Deltaproteobacteria bacterium]|nr:acetoacetate decarboxylase family protein [Deltaproteobacteria bacterium]